MKKSDLNRAKIKNPYKTIAGSGRLFCRVTQKRSADPKNKSGSSNEEEKLEAGDFCVNQKPEGVLCVLAVILQSYAKRSGDPKSKSGSSNEEEKSEARDFCVNQRKTPKEYFVYFEGFFCRVTQKDPLTL